MDRARSGTLRPRRPRRVAPLLVAALVLAAAAVVAGTAASVARANGTIVADVVDQSTGLPVSGIVLEVSPWSVQPGYYEATATGTTGDSGSLSMSVPAGTYKISAAEERYVPPLAWPHLYWWQWWDRKTQWSKSDKVVVTDGEQTTVPIEMVVGGHLAGTVTDTSGAPLPGMRVSVLSADPSSFEAGGFATTDESGAYDVAGLATGSYTVSVNDDDPPYTYLFQYFPDQPTDKTATRFSVVAGETAAGPDIVMKRAGRISGKLTTHAGVVPHDVMCGVDRQNADGTWALFYTGSDCNNDCTYDVLNVPPGHYRLWFRWEFSSNPRNLPQYYKDTYWPDQAAQFDMTEGEHLTGMDAVIWGDTDAPVTRAPVAVGASQGTVAGLRYEVSDAGRHGPMAAVKIEIKNRAGKIVKLIRIAHAAVNRLHTCRYTCGLPKGRYRFCVFAIDSGGNRQKRIASNVLTIR